MLKNMNYFLKKFIEPITLTKKQWDKMQRYLNKKNRKIEYIPKDNPNIVSSEEFFKKYGKGK